MDETAPLDVVSQGPDETRRVGALLGALLAAGDVLLLEGQLGAGKTVFAQGVAAGLDVSDAVTSPTFTLIHEHAGRVPLYHVDLYRIEGDVDAVALGLEDYLRGDGVAVVEWAGRAAQLMPAERLQITLVPGDGANHRIIRISGAGARWQGLRAALVPLLCTAPTDA
ncbi:MAG: tRNA (adenosine(37)-N6)-threonylcarbamoyltransferase complex ATPase subunit type 1 TsaE [Chloroflexota bacterium]|nr:tRNA (adenosine(37)-N6)-threonylcarbamoyltransferase complex ATPase subunit type 1 TsaE [Chloroflexota bacterium]